MQTTYVGQVKVIKHQGRIFTMAAKGAIMNIEWADNILSNPPIIFPNGRNSHEVAGEVIDMAEDEIISYLLVTA